MTKNLINKIKILYVDDDPDQHLLVTEGLADTNINVVSALSFLEAIQLLESNADDVHLILLDLNLGDSRGKDTLINMKSRFPIIPIIVITNTTDISIEKDLLASGAQDYLIKGDFKYDFLGKIINKTILTYMEYQQLKKSNSELSSLVNLIKIGKTDEILSFKSHSSLYKLLDMTDFETMFQHIKEQQKHLNYLAKFDHLTGIINRRTFESLLQKNIARSKRNNDFFAVVSLDIDYFKDINDKFGHHIGDKYLKEFVILIQSIIRANDVFARVGGDEFSILLSDIQSPEDAGFFVEKIYNKARNGLEIEGINYSIKLSCGIACYPSVGLIENEINICSDLALYKAKKSGRNNYVYYNQGIKCAHERKLSLQALFHSPVDQVFTGALQKIYSINNENHSNYSLMGYELLIRLKNDNNPQFFIEEIVDEAIRCSKLSSLSTYLIEKASNYFCNLKKNHNILFINLSVSQVLETRLISDLSKVFKQLNISPHQVCFEITESELINPNLDVSVVASLKAIRALGYKVAIDDFGKGYSSLSRLIEFSVDFLKLDMSFTHQMEYNEKVRDVIQMIVNFSKKLGMEVIIEGIENENQLTIAIKLGVDHAQGFFLDTPKNIDCPPKA